MTIYEKKQREMHYTAPDNTSLIKKNLKKKFNETDEKELSALTREVIFAPNSYKTKINNKELNISNIRETLADTIENTRSAAEFIPYSLDAEIADLIEQANCETSSMNEYYRWVTASMDIIKRTSDGDVSKNDTNEREDFLAMSYDREAEILLCLALYEGTSSSHNKEKIDLLKFKLARLREMRSLVRNTPSRPTRHPLEKEKLAAYYQYCHDLLTENNIFSKNFNLKLKLNIDDDTDEYWDDNLSYLDNLRQKVLYTMHFGKETDIPNTRSETLVQTEQNIFSSEKTTVLLSNQKERE